MIVPLRRLTYATATTTLLVLVAACANDGGPEPAGQTEDSALAALIEAAQEEGSLTLYGAPSQEALQDDADAFEDAYEISVDFVQVTAGPLTVRLDQEFAANQILADVILTTDTVALDRWYDEGKLTDLPDVDYPPARETHYAPIQSIGQGIIYNTSRVAEPDLPRTWKDLLDPKWSGQIVLGSPRIGPGYIGVYHALLADPTYGEDFFEALVGNEPRVLESPALVSQAVVSGEAAIGFTAFEYLAANARADSPNAPIDFTYLDIAPVIQTHIAIVKDSPNPAAAELFARWMMSPDGQAVHNGDNRATSPLGTYESTLGEVPSDVVRTFPQAELNAAHPEIIAMFDRLFG